MQILAECTVCLFVYIIDSVCLRHGKQEVLIKPRLDSNSLFYPLNVESSVRAILYYFVGILK